MRGMTVMLGVFLVIAATPAAAQPEDRKVTGHIGGGYTFSLGEIREHLGDGYNVTFGATFHINETIGIQTEYAFNGLGEKQITLPTATPPPGVNLVRDLFANSNMQYGTFNLVFKPGSGGAVKPYFVAGMGIYYRPVQVTTPGLGYVPPYCSPWYYWCWPGGVVPVDYILSEKSSTDMGLDFGGGVNFALGESTSFYAEARYHYIFGPELKDASGASQGKANGQFLPIVFGLRF